ncbi:MAG: branched-chain amino acid ABC transporter ATP-binding protein/permease [Proteobacteria bacterium]|nr:branched-chain amino acid ABC transporter ATP-binding protein/permease [Pseudomonadota bacterium]
MNAARDLPRLGAVLAIGAMALLPMARLPAFYDSFLYLVFFWISLSTSWALLSGFAGYFSLGHAAFFGLGVYVTADLTTKFGWPFLATLPVAAALPALLALGIGAIVFRLRRLRGELFALLTLSVTFVIATIILNTPIDGGGGIFMSAVPLPDLMPTPTGTIYLLGFVLCVITLLIAWKVVHSRLGMGLFAIHDDEDVAEAKGVPTLRYKLTAFALSAGIAGAVGGVHAMYVGFITTSGIFELTVPLYVVLMSVLGGARSWFGPAIGATVITTLLYAFISGGEAMVGRAIVAVILISAILWLPEGFVPAVKQWLARHRRAPARAPLAEVAPVVPAARPVSDTVLLQVRGATKRFGGLQALGGVDLDVRQGEILGLVGPNGSGKTTLINVVSGFYPLTSGSVSVAGVEIGHLPAHEIARRGVARTYQIPRPFVNMTVLENVVLAATFGMEDSSPFRWGGGASPLSHFVRKWPIRDGGVMDDSSDAAHDPSVGVKRRHLPRRRGRKASEIRDEALHWIGFTGLAGKEDVLPAGLNLHERKFLELARALAARPKLLLLDEVLSGLNPAEVDNAIRLVRAIRAQGATIVFVEHLMRAVVELSDRVAVLNEGRLFALGAPRDVMRDPRVVSIYLGKAYAA